MAHYKPSATPAERELSLQARMELRRMKLGSPTPTITRTATQAGTGQRAEVDHPSHSHFDGRPKAKLYKTRSLPNPATSEWQQLERESIESIEPIQQPRLEPIPEPASQLSYAEFEALEEAGEVPRIVRPLGDAFCSLLNTAMHTQAAAEQREPPPLVSFEELVDAVSKPCVQLRVAAEHYTLQCSSPCAPLEHHTSAEYKWVLIGTSSVEESQASLANASLSTHCWVAANTTYGSAQPTRLLSQLRP